MIQQKCTKYDEDDSRPFYWLFKGCWAHLSCIILLSFLLVAPFPFAFSQGKLRLLSTYRDNIQPKSITYIGNGLFFAQNMMYAHTISVLDRNLALQKTINDQVRPADHGFEEFTDLLKGSPVEAAVSADQEYVYVSNFSMEGPGFNNPGSDDCSGSSSYDPSFVYKIGSRSLAVENIYEVGATPKYLATSPDGKFLLVANWCAGNISIIDLDREKEVKRVYVGRYPRGISFDLKSRYAYVALMGVEDIAVVSLSDYSVSKIRKVGGNPRHLITSPDGKYLYVSLNGEGKVAKVDLNSREIIKKIYTGRAPRSMALSKNGDFLYVVNYFSNTVSKLRTRDMRVMTVAETREKPIGICIDPVTKYLWVACYSGSIMVYEDTYYQQPVAKREAEEGPRFPIPPRDERRSQLDMFTRKAVPTRGSLIFQDISDSTQSLAFMPPTTYAKDSWEEEEEFSQDTFEEEFEEGAFMDEPQEQAMVKVNDPVSQSVNTPSPRPATPPTSTMNMGRPLKPFLVVVGSFGDKLNATNRVEEFAGKGVKSDIMIYRGKYRLTSGGFDTQSAAHKWELTLENDYGIDAWVWEHDL
ncbi:MAG: beta-propeller fold lactonase family protein [Bacteroidota bacterium]